MERFSKANLKDVLHAEPSLIGKSRGGGQKSLNSDSAAKKEEKNLSEEQPIEKEEAKPSALDSLLSRQTNVEETIDESQNEENDSVDSIEELEELLNNEKKVEEIPTDPLKKRFYMFGMISAIWLLLGANMTLFFPYVWLPSENPDGEPLWDEKLFNVFAATEIFPNSIDYSQGGSQAMFFSIVVLNLVLPIVVLAIVKLIKSIVGMTSSKDPNNFQKRKEKKKGIAPNPSLYLYCFVILNTAILVFSSSYKVGISALLWIMSVIGPFVVYVVLYSIQRKVLKEAISK